MNTSTHRLTRRAFTALTAAGALAAAPRRRRIPVGLELYSVREELTRDLTGTVRAVAKLGYEGVEFYAPYFEWTADYAKEVRGLLDDLGIRCFSTHNSAQAFMPENLPRAIELNQILGSRLIVMAGAGRVDGLNGWKAVSNRLAEAAETLRPLKLRAGYHNHQAEFMRVEGQRPMDVIAANTGSEVVLQLDVGTCLEAGADPVAWISANPGRVASIHCKDWSPEPGKGYEVLFGEGAAPWKKIFQAAENTGGVLHYLIEQEGSPYPPMETAERCLAAFRKLRAG